MKLDLRDVAGSYKSGQILGEDLPTVAEEALAAGSSSPSLLELSLQPTGLGLDLDENRRLFFAALKELGISEPTHNESLWISIRMICRSVNDGRLEVMEGAREIARISAALEGDDADLLVLRRTLSNQDDLESYREENTKDQEMYHKNIATLRKEMLRLAGP